MDQPDCDPEQLFRTLDQFKGINILFSRVRKLLRQTVLKDMKPGTRYHLVDLGAGACDIPVWLLQQARRRGLDLHITAVDADPRVIKYARDKHAEVDGLTILETDALNLQALAPFDYLFANHFLHHLPDDVLPGLIYDAYMLCNRGFVFSDLKRSRFSYLAFSILAKIYRNSFAREDGLISIRKGFQEEDFQKISRSIPVKIQTAFPGRIQLLSDDFRKEKLFKKQQNIPVDRRENIRSVSRHSASGVKLEISRLKTNPIIRPYMDDRMGSNINGPSLIRVPEWVTAPLGKYYLYFAHHGGTYIRLAYADRLEGPWKLHGPGVLNLSDSFANNHIASPDVHVLNDEQEIRMYYHGCCMPNPPHQVTRLATSRDGLSFSARSEVLGTSYWRAFHWNDYWYTLEMPGIFRRSANGISDFELGPITFTRDMRHSAVLIKENTLHVFFSNVQDCPERILWSSIDLRSDWQKWTATRPETLLRPEEDWEGADCLLEPSVRGAVHHRVHQLRDPCIFEEEGKTYLLYSVAGEYGIGIAELTMR